MRCSTCGELLDPRSPHCVTCGSPVPVMHSLAPVRRCPRCGYRGEGIRYFRRTAHLGLLVGLTLFTYAVGGVVYWLLKRNHRVCPSCGLGWEHASFGRVEGGGYPLQAGGGDPRGGGDREEPLPGTGIGRRILGAGVAIAALLAMSVGLVEWEPAVMAAGAVMGVAGSGTFLWGWRALQERRAAVLTSMQRRVLSLASLQGGVLTVSEVAARLQLSIPAAERILIGMDDGFRVRSEITDEGLILYEFPELKPREPPRTFEARTPDPLPPRSPPPAS